MHFILFFNIFEWVILKKGNASFHYCCFFLKVLIKRINYIVLIKNEKHYTIFELAQQVE